MEQYDINLTYVPGKTNVLADCFSRLPWMDGPSQGNNEDKEQSINFRTTVVPKDKDDVFMTEIPTLLPSICSNDDMEVIKLFMNLPQLAEMPCPMTVNNIQQYQVGDALLVQTALTQFQNYPMRVINGRKLVCYHADPNTVENNWKI